MGNQCNCDQFFQNTGDLQLTEESTVSGRNKPEKPKRLRSSKRNDDDLFIKKAIEEHNRYRQEHHVPILKENEELNKIAQQYANYLVQNRRFEHSDNTYQGEPIGESFYVGKEISPERMVSNWYNENKDYDYDNPDVTSKRTAHFTQMVWKETREVGFGIARNDKGWYYVVANYYPIGNQVDQYSRNVLKK